MSLQNDSNDKNSKTEIENNQLDLDNKKYELMSKNDLIDTQKKLRSEINKLQMQLDMVNNELYLDEPLLNKNNFRYTIKPYDKQYEILWQLYKKQESAFWTAEEIDFSKDYDDFLTLSKDEQHFVEMVLAFFASSDGIVNLNLRERFLQEIQIVEAQGAYGFQLAMEFIHGEIYSDMLINIVKDENKKKELFGAISNVQSIKKISDWAIKWVSSDDCFAQRLIAFAIVEAVFFSGAFAAIFWLKHTRGTNKLFMEGLIKSNKFISRDESLHAMFACALYSFVNNKPPLNVVHDMFKEAVEISNEFTNDAIQVKLLGISNKSMNEYIKYVSDRLLVMLGYEKMFNASNPFDFMETIGFISKDNFFETRPDAYQKAHNEENKEKWQFTIIDDF